MIMAGMQTYRGIVRKGRIQITPPTDLPEGSEVYIVVAEQASTPVENVYVSPERQAMQEEKARFQAMLPDLLTRYENQYVALYQGKIVDHDQDKIALALRLDKTHPNTAVLIQKVTAESEPILRMPSPRLTRNSE